jgi:putative nucleotidyltransferase with HDIG domain
MDKDVSTGTPSQGDSSTDRRPVLRVGARLTANVYSPQGVLVLRAGRVIENEDQMSRLFRHGVRFGRKRQAVPEQRESEDRVDPLDPRAKALQAKIHHATEVKSVAVRQVSSVFERIETTGKVDIPAVAGAVSGLVDELLGDRLALASLVQLKDVDAYTFTHSVNVAILAMYLAANTHLEDELEGIGIGAILHDIGKVRTPRSVLAKKGPLDETERRVIQRHPQYGVDRLLESGFHDAVGLACVLDHHEKATGTGYPRGKRATELSPYAKITGLADIYDALTTDRPYRKAMKPQEALLLMIEKMSGELDPWLLDRFIWAVGYLTENTTVSPEGEVAPRTCHADDAEVTESLCKLENSIARIVMYV